MAGRNLSKHEKHIQKMNKQYQDNLGLENDFYTALNTAFKDVNEDMKQKQKENQEKTNNALEADFQAIWNEAFSNAAEQQEYEEHQNKIKPTGRKPFDW